MTTHDQHTDVHDNQGATRRAEQPGQYATENPDHIPEDQVAPIQPEAGTGQHREQQRHDEQHHDEQHHVERHHVERHDDRRENDAEAGLFAHDELAGLRARWDAVQASFVDDPKDCVQKADSLVSDLVQQLTTGFGQARSRLEEQWSRGEQASTEDLRVALKRYRSFFERLLSV